MVAKCCTETVCRYRQWQTKQTTRERTVRVVGNRQRVCRSVTVDGNRPDAMNAFTCSSVRGDVQVVGTDEEDELEELDTLEELLEEQTVPGGFPVGPLTGQLLFVYVELPYHRSSW